MGFEGQPYEKVRFRTQKRCSPAVRRVGKTTLVKKSSWRGLFSLFQADPYQMRSDTEAAVEIKC